MKSKPLIVETDIPPGTAVMVITETDLGYDCTVLGNEDDSAFALAEACWDIGREKFVPEPEDLH